MERLLYTHKDLSTNYAIEKAYNAKYGVITTNWKLESVRNGIGDEFIFKAYDDHNGLYVTRNRTMEEKPVILYISPDSENEINNLIRVISVFNSTLKVLCCIYCLAKHRSLLTKVANGHVNIIFDDGNGTLLPPCDVVITHGSGALHFIKQEIPVMIIGFYGFSGLITPDNFPFLLREGFMGRAGGHYDERISAPLVLDEILTLFKIETLSEILTGNREKASAAGVKPLSGMHDLEEMVKRTEEIRLDKNGIWRLRPRLASNILIKESGENVFLRRKEINDTLLTTHKNALTLLTSMDGRLDCRSLFKLSKLREAIFWQLIHLFFDNKIIQWTYDC